MKLNTKTLISELCTLRGVSGREAAVGQAVANHLRTFVPDAAYHDGCVSAHIGNAPEKPVLLFCAHLDQVGFLVTDITEDGFLRIGSVGGIDHRILLGQPVIISGTETLHGVISILPPHLLQGEQAVPDDAQLCVDLGYSSKKALMDKVKVGDAVYYATTPQELQNGFLTAPALDDRCGVAALLLAAEALSNESALPCNVTFWFSGQEERSGRGAKLAAAIGKPDCAIAVDVTFGTAHGEDPQECMEMGKGPAIGISSVLSPELSDALISTAKRINLPYQTEIMPGLTGTDADSLTMAPNGCAAGTVSIPLRYMHTPVEVIAISDVEQTAKLLIEFAKEYGR